MMKGTKMAVVVAIPVAAAVVMLLWSWPMIIQDNNGGLSMDESSIFGPDNRKAPESWHSETSTYLDRSDTDSEYDTTYNDCTLQMVKDGTGTDVISFWLYMECARESGVPSTYGNDTQRFHFMTVPADFEASWPGNTYCQMTLTHYNTYNSSSSYDTTDSTVYIYCND